MTSKDKFYVIRELKNYHSDPACDIFACKNKAIFRFVLIGISVDLCKQCMDEMLSDLNLVAKLHNYKEIV
ncbi:MAG: hypothetical protein LC122_02580 [Chitinophagales bacterium]|nr:hypothetical protein [Chitinophagales bacterium]